jgi:hypothetical protein
MTGVMSKGVKTTLLFAAATLAIAGGRRLTVAGPQPGGALVVSRRRQFPIRKAHGPGGPAVDLLPSATASANMHADPRGQ